MGSNTDSFEEIAEDLSKYVDIRSRITDALAAIVGPSSRWDTILLAVVFFFQSIRLLYFRLLFINFFSLSTLVLIHNDLWYTIIMLDQRIVHSHLKDLEGF